MFVRTSVGIEAMVAHVPRHFLDLNTMAEANAVDPAKYTLGLGGRRIAVPAPCEDPVTMGYEAASNLLAHYEVDPATIGLLVVGTESGVDGAKPIASYLHGLLGLSGGCRTFDTKHACYSCTAALRMAADWCAMRQGRRQSRALVVASDIARYTVGSSGEPTQGAGALAMLLGERGDCLQLDPHPESVYTEEVMDFWRPHYRREAVVDGRTSIASYLKALEHTWREYSRSSGLGFDDYDYLLFHVPFPKMAQKAMRLLYDREVERRGAGALPPFEEVFATKTMPGLWANMELGNLYSGSLYLSLASLLERGDREVQGARIGLFSYGSGCCAEFFSGRVGGNALAWRDRIGIAPGLVRRQELSYQRYLQFRQAGEEIAREGSFAEILAGKSAEGDQPFCFQGIRNHQRVYSRMPPRRPYLAVSNSES